MLSLLFLGMIQRMKLLKTIHLNTILTIYSPLKLILLSFLKKLKNMTVIFLYRLALIKYLKVKLYQFLKLELLIAMQVNYLFSAEEIS